MNTLSNDLLVLSAREIQVINLIADGKTSREIGPELCLSPRTVERYREEIFHKLQVKNAAQAVRKCMRVGILA
jgi:DNA-binding NarL/FixJ family response regulator